MSFQRSETSGYGQWRNLGCWPVLQACCDGEHPVNALCLTSNVRRFCLVARRRIRWRACTSPTGTTRVSCAHWRLLGRANAPAKLEDLINSEVNPLMFSYGRLSPCACYRMLAESTQCPCCHWSAPTCNCKYRYMSDAGTLYQNYLSKSNFARIRTLDSSAWSDQVSWDAVGSSQAPPKEQTRAFLRDRFLRNANLPPGGRSCMEVTRRTASHRTFSR